MKDESRGKWLKRGVLEGYRTDRTFNGNAYEITTYQGDHRDEYLVREVKSGRCWLFYKGILQQGWKEMNEGQIREWTENKMGTEANLENGLELGEEKDFRYQMYCESMKNDVKYSFLELCKRDGLCWIHKGIVEKSSSVVLQLNVGRVVEVNVESHELLSVNGEDVSGVEHNTVLNLSDEGERWEGDVLHDEPYGWGVMYDKEGEMAYEGFRIGDVSSCYGTQYYTDIGVIEYEGEICEGKRWGRGIQYDRNGVVVYDGEWLNDGQLKKRIVLNDKTEFLHSCIEELIVSNRSCNGIEWIGLDLLCMPHLRLLQVGDNCFKNVNEVKLVGLHALEKVLIGKHCFNKRYKNDPTRHFYLKDCEQLKELKIGCYSFLDYSVCEIANVPSLEEIEMGELDEVSGNFRYASLELKNLPKLKSLLFGDHAFCDCSRAAFENLPELTSIQLGQSAFSFSGESSELIMRNLPKLTSLTTIEYSGTFISPHRITLEDLPSLTTVTLDKARAFTYKKTLHTKNITPALQHYLS